MSADSSPPIGVLPPLREPSFEESMLEAERYLTRTSNCAIFGSSIAGPLKILMGTAQLIAGLVVTIFTLLAVCCSKKAREIFDKAWSHIIHGFGNILAGIIETIPFVALIRSFGGSVQNLNISENQEDKWMRYWHLPHEAPLQCCCFLAI